MGKRLSLSKITDYLSKFKYFLISVYCSGDRCVFIECKTPIHQKTFIIYVPEKYDMIISDEISIKRLNFIRVDKPSTRQAEYMNTIKGIIDCDLLSISSNSICVLKNSGAFESFVIREEGGRDYEEFETIDEDEITAVDNLEKELGKIASRIEPTKEIPDVIEKSDDESLSMDSFSASDDVIEKEELIFEDIVEKEEEIPVKEVIKSTESQRDNSLPTMIEDSEIHLGLIYVLVDLTTFFRKAGNLEGEIIDYYEQIEGNESDARETRLETIKDLSTRLDVMTTDKINKIKEEEASLKACLIRLTQFLNQAETLRKKTKGSQKYVDVNSDIDAVYYNTRKTINDLNIQLLQIRDKVDEFLYAYQTSLEDLLEM